MEGFPFSLSLCDFPVGSGRGPFFAEAVLLVSFDFILPLEIAFLRHRLFPPYPLSAGSLSIVPISAPPV